MEGNRDGRGFYCCISSFIRRQVCQFTIKLMATYFDLEKELNEIINASVLVFNKYRRAGLQKRYLNFLKLIKQEVRKFYETTSTIE